MPAIAVLAAPWPLVSGGVLVAALVLFPHPARAEPEHASLGVTRSAGASACADGPTLAAAIARVRKREALDTTPGSRSPLRFDVEFEREVSGYVATVRESGVHTGEHTFAGADAPCSDLTEVLAVAMTLILDADDKEVARVAGARLVSSAAPAKSGPEPAAEVPPTLPQSRPPERMRTVSVELAALAGSGLSGGLAGESPNPFGFGLGVRVGIAYAGVYGGLSFVNNFGTTDAFHGSSHSNTFGFEAGYGLVLARLITIRLTLGLGNYGETFDDSGPPHPDYLYVAPDLAVLLSLGSTLFLGAGATVFFVPNYQTPFVAGCGGGESTCSTTYQVTLQGQLGVRFWP
jgi:hypothetical protein